MNKKKSKDLINKYLAAESTLEEELDFFNSEKQDSGIAQWSAYVKGSKEKVPTNLKESIWSAIQIKKRKKQHYLIRLSGIAASIVLLGTFLIYNANNAKSEYAEKEALLKEALSLANNKIKTTEHQHIIYEDDMITIYIASN